MNINHLLDAIDVFFPDDKLVEVRSFPTGRYKKTLSGYFRNKSNLIEQLQKYPENTFYFVLNSIKDECYSREQNEQILDSKYTTSDKDISGINWLLIDVDPVRGTGISSDDEEKEEAKNVILQVYRYLKQMGFSRPVSADSGNGYHLLYKIDLTNTPECVELIKNVLLVLDMLFSNDRAEVDTSVFNPSRITKLYGTVARKGADTKERPHRDSHIVKKPKEIKPTSVALLQKVADVLPKPEPVQSYRKQYGDYERFDVRNFISKHGIQVKYEGRFSGGTKYVLEHCVFDPNHKAPDAAILERDDGNICYHCFHNSCQDKSWKDVRKLFEPSAYVSKGFNDTRVVVTPSTSQSAVRTHFNGSQAHSQLEQQPNLPIFQKMSEIEKRDRSKIVTIPTGFTELDKRILGFNLGEMSVWSGGNGSAKSTVLNQIAIECVERGRRVAIFSGELTKYRVKEWIHLQAAGRQNTTLSNNGVSYWVKSNIAEKIDQWMDDRLFIYNNDWGFSVDGVMQSLEEHVLKHGTEVLILDNLMSLDMRAYGSDKNSNQTALVLKLSEFCKKFNVHIHFVCHPRKPQGFFRKYDVSGTADITNAADNVIMVHRVNNDYRINAKTFLGTQIANEYEKYTNILEVMKNRDLGVEDFLVGLYYEPESKRLLNQRHENKAYGWEMSVILEDLEAFD